MKLNADLKSKQLIFPIKNEFTNFDNNKHVQEVIFSHELQKMNHPT